MDNRPTRSWIPQALAAGSLQYFWSHVALPLIVTIGAPVVTGWIAWVQERNWLYVVLAAQLSFALGPFGLVWFEVWRARRRVEDKLAIEVGKPGREIEFVRGKHCIKVIQSTLTITNKALFPISYVIDDIDTRVVGHAHVYQDARVANRSGIVPAESSYEYKDKPVSIPGGVQDKRFYVTVGFSARYGRPGNEKYPIKAKRRLEFVENPGSRALDVFVYPDIEEHGGQ